MEKTRIFISYKRKNKDQVFSIVNKIETQLGVKCWVDLDGIESSAQFRSKICNAIDSAQVVLFMHSSVHLNIDFDNDWTIKELNYAEAKGKRVVLVKLDNAPLDNIFLLDYGTKNNIDSRDETQFQKLLKDLRTWLNLSQKEQESNHQTTYNLKSSSKIHKIYDEDGNLLYEGEMKDGKFHGRGTLYFNDGDKYIGQFEKDVFHGQGTIYYTNGNIYEGQFQDGVQHGNGTEYYANGDKYVGQFEYSNINGIGEYFYANGDRYRGECKYGSRNGYGTLYFANGNKYEGHFEHDEFHGQGTYYYADGGKYVGEFKEGNKHGQGTRYWPDGDKYIGQWEDDKKQGQGTYYFANLNKYEGQWKNDKRHGIGTFYWNNGNKYMGLWKNDLRHGRGIHYSTDGPPKNLTFDNGKQI